MHQTLQYAVHEACVAEVGEALALLAQLHRLRHLLLDFKLQLGLGLACLSVVSA